MNKLTALFAITTLATTAGIAQARDLGPDEALKLRDAGTIQSFEMRRMCSGILSWMPPAVRSLKTSAIIDRSPDNERAADAALVVFSSRIASGLPYAGWLSGSAAFTVSRRLMYFQSASSM